MSGERRAVEIVQWPEDAAHRRALVAAGVPRLLVVAAGQDAPAPIDDLEDVVWTPTDDRQLFARLDALAARLGPRLPIALDEITVTEEGLLLVGSHRVPLPPVEAALVRCLLRPPRGVRSREELGAAAWGTGTRQRRSLDSRILTLRGRIEGVGLIIRSIHGRGFLLDAIAG